jgi:hypothetical protein
MACFARPRGDVTTVVIHFPKAHDWLRRLDRGLLGLAACLVAMAIPAVAASDDRYISELIARSRQLDLAKQDQWHALLHYRSNALLPGVTSQVDDPLFFLAAQGRADPQAELDATLRAFASTEILPGKDEHSQCAFVARYRWLKAVLDFDTARLPPQPCQRFAEWYGRIAPQTLTLVFPTAYMNNPASMFGHTLLRFDAAGLTEQTRLLAYSANYGANTGDDNGVVFAFKGIAGLYPGYVSIAPYYETTKKYSDLENRDIWEYALRLTPQQVETVLLHIWELRGIYARYYFFSENCSYELMLLLDVARPELRLREQFGYWVIPVDTLRVLHRQGLVASAVYRPASGTKLRYRAASMSKQAQRMIFQLGNGELVVNDAPLRILSAAERASIYALSYDYMRYEFAGRRKTRDQMLDVSRSLLEARSQLDAASIDSLEPPTPTAPELGHRTGLLEGGIGRMSGLESATLRWRPAYHDLYAPSEGYVRGAQIEFFDTVLRYQPQRNSLRLDELRFVDIVSASPRTLLFRPKSWLVNAALTRPVFPDYADQRHLSFQFEAGAGAATELSQGPLAFGFLKVVLDANKDLQRNYATGFALDLGMAATALSRYTLGLRGNVARYIAGENFTRYHGEIDQRFALTKQHAIRILYEHDRVGNRHEREATVAWSHYF